jgi:dUTP pyrophosphatase
MNSLIIDTVFENLVEKYSSVNSNVKGDSGYDLFMPETVAVLPKSQGTLVHLGIKVAMYNEHGQSIGFMLLPRSSTGSKTPLRLSNSVGIIDRGYRGEIMALVDNLSDQPFTMKEGERYFQLVPFDGNGVHQVDIGLVDETDRGSGGFGSTGK